MPPATLPVLTRVLFSDPRHLFAATDNCRRRRPRTGGYWSPRLYLPAQLWPQARLRTHAHESEEFFRAAILEKHYRRPKHDHLAEHCQWTCTRVRERPEYEPESKVL